MRIAYFYYVSFLQNILSLVGLIRYVFTFSNLGSIYSGSYLVHYKSLKSTSISRQFVCDNRCIISEMNHSEEVLKSCPLAKFEYIFLCHTQNTRCKIHLSSLHKVSQHQTDCHFLVYNTVYSSDSNRLINLATSACIYKTIGRLVPEPGHGGLSGVACSP